MSRDDRLLVTGAAGFIGGHLIRAGLNWGWKMRGLARPGSALPRGAEAAVYSDVTDRPAVRVALDGVTAVVHLSARAHVARDHGPNATAEYRRVNVLGTRLLFEEAARVGVARFVFVSSVGAVCRESEAVISEETAPRPATPYGRSKLEAEEAVQELATASGMATIILRPPMVYGPGMRGNALRLFQLIDRGIPLPFGAVRNRRSLLYVGNLVAAVRAVLESGCGEGGAQTFFVADGHDLSTPDLIRSIAEALDRPARLIAVSPSLLRGVGRVADALSQFLPIPVTSRSLDAVLGSLPISIAKLQRETAFAPPYTPAEALRETAAWYRKDTASRRTI